MSNKAFISYSRQDNEFALKLAKDLRSAGVDLWLDQLDIASGERWDDITEKALERSDILIVILSPAATDSANVMAGIAYESFVGHDPSYF